MGLLYGRAGCLTTENAGGFRPGQSPNNGYLETAANTGMGVGFVSLIAERLMASDISTRGGSAEVAVHCFNRGRGGARIVDAWARISEDALVVEPDVLSMLFGVNDAYDELVYTEAGVRGPGRTQSRVPLPKFERTYRLYLEEMREQNPRLRLVLCEPFVLDCGAIASDGYDEWRGKVDARREIVRQLAAEFVATVVDFQGMFDKACKGEAPEHWSADGCHPTEAGAKLMAGAWLAAVGDAYGLVRY
jgi:lysophospholipase L1-like esterase